MSWLKVLPDKKNKEQKYLMIWKKKKGLLWNTDSKQCYKLILKYFQYKKVNVYYDFHRVPVWIQL